MKTLRDIIDASGGSAQRSKFNSSSHVVIVDKKTFEKYQTATSQKDKATFTDLLTCKCPVVSPNWVLACLNAGKLVDTWSFRCRNLAQLPNESAADHSARTLKQDSLQHSGLFSRDIFVPTGANQKVGLTIVQVLFILEAFDEKGSFGGYESVAMSLKRLNTNQHAFAKEDCFTADFLRSFRLVVLDHKCPVQQEFSSVPFFPNHTLSQEENAANEQLHARNEEMQRGYYANAKEIVAGLVAAERQFSTEQRDPNETEATAEQATQEAKNHRSEKRKRKRNFDLLENNRIVRQGIQSLELSQQLMQSQISFESVHLLLCSAKELGMDLTEHRDAVGWLLEKQLLEPYREAKRSRVDDIAPLLEDAADTFTQDDEHETD